MKPNLGRLSAKPKSGYERFHQSRKRLPFTLREFWSWSASDLLNNLGRGLLAEFIVAKALGVADGVRNPWAPYDLITRQRKKIEIKSAAYLQSWNQDELSSIQFNVQKKKALDPKRGGYRGKPRRYADVYVFALLAETSKRKIDPLNLHQWQFYALPTKVLNHRKRSQHSITLNSLQKLTAAVPYGQLASAVRKASR